VRPRRLVSTLCLILALALLIGWTPAHAKPDPTPQPGTGVSTAELQAMLDQLVANGATGAIALVDDGPRTRRLASGAARLEPYQPMHPSARVRVGSLTKTVVATVALQLVGEGSIGLDDTVEEWLPGLLPDGDKITLRMLLNHTSGLFDYFNDPAFVAQLEADLTRRWAPRELVAVATSHPLTFQPGQGWAYSNTGYIVAGMLLEEATGRSLESLVRQRIVRRLHLHDTYLPTRPTIRGYHARGYYPPALTGSDYVDVTEVSPSVAWAAGALISTASDMRRVYQALLGGRLLRRALLQQMLTMVQLDPTNAYGLGVYRVELPCGTVWGHTGNFPGYFTIAVNDLSGRRSAVVIISTQADPPLLELLDQTVTAAACKMLRRPLPATARSKPLLPMEMGQPLLKG
jgi:D-alanyl-D-alanine carboxypeptidase